MSPLQRATDEMAVNDSRSRGIIWSILMHKLRTCLVANLTVLRIDVPAKQRFALFEGQERFWYMYSVELLWHTCGAGKVTQGSACSSLTESFDCARQARKSSAIRTYHFFRNHVQQELPVLAWKPWRLHLPCIVLPQHLTLVNI